MRKRAGERYGMKDKEREKLEVARRSISQLLSVKKGERYLRL